MSLISLYMRERFKSRHLPNEQNVVPIYLRFTTKWAPHLCHSFRFDRAHTQYTLLIHSFVLLLLLVVVVCALTTTTTASAAAVVAISVSVFYFCPTHFSKGKCWFLQYFSIGTIRANIHKVKDCWQYIITILLLVVVIFVYRVFSDPSFFAVVVVIALYSAWIGTLMTEGVHFWHVIVITSLPIRHA